MFQADDSDDDEGEEVSEVDLLQVSEKFDYVNIYFNISIDEKSFS